MILSDSGSHEYEQCPPGTHVARCIRLIDLGTQQSDFQGVVSHKRQVIIGWELPNELLSEGDFAGSPFTISKFFTASLHEKSNLRAQLSSWRGQEFSKEELQAFDAKTILGKPCLLSVIHNDKGKARVAAVMALPRGTQVPPVVNQPIYLSLEPDAFVSAVFDSLSDGIRKIIELSPEFKRLTERQARPATLARPAQATPIDDTRADAFNDEEETAPF